MAMTVNGRVVVAKQFLMFGQSLVSENNLRLNSMSAQLGKYLMVTACGRVEAGSIPPGNAPYIFVIPANAGRVGRWVGRVNG
jgi:hypothetical protein